jgi:hypothetical protein
VKCWNCGAENRQNAVTCEKCGESLRPAEPKKTLLIPTHSLYDESPHLKLVTLVVVVAGFAMVAAGAWLVVSAEIFKVGGSEWDQTRLWIGIVVALLGIVELTAMLTFAFVSLVLWRSERSERD